MIPRIGSQGRSFKGAALYYLHDKDALTDERVAFAETRNLPTQNAELGWRLMAATAMDADRLKEESGVARTGRKSTKPVWTLSLSWHPDEQPESAHMMTAMDSALAALGLQDRQAIYVRHTDEPHAHLHAIVSLVHPETGRSTSVSHSKEKLSEWALAYEREYGVYCHKRLTRTKQRSQTPNLKSDFDRAAPPPALDLKAETTRRYQAADSGKAFVAAMKELGYQVALGNRPVMIGPDGRVHSIARNIDGVVTKDIRAMLDGLTLPSLDDARGQTGQRDGSAGRVDHYDRDQQEHEQNERIIDAGIAHDAAQRKAQRAPRRASADDPLRIDPLTAAKNRAQDARLVQWGAFYDRTETERLALEARLEEAYGEAEVRAQIAAAETARPGFLKSRRAAAEELTNLRRSLANIEQRKTEARGMLTATHEEQRRAIEMTQRRGHRQFQPEVAPQTRMEADLSAAAATRQPESPMQEQISDPLADQIRERLRNARKHGRSM